MEKLNLKDKRGESDTKEQMIKIIIWIIFFILILAALKFVLG